MGVELALETRNFRSRPLARQLGASVYLKAAVPQRMELSVPTRSPHPFSGSVRPERNSRNYRGDKSKSRAALGPQAISAQRIGQRGVRRQSPGALASWSVMRTFPSVDVYPEGCSHELRTTELATRQGPLGLMRFSQVLPGR